MAGVAGGPWYLTQYWDTASGTAQDFADAAYVVYQSLMVMVKSTVVLTQDPLVTVLDSTTGQPTGTTVVTAGANISGTATQELLPTQVQLGVQLLTGVYSGGRQIRGHWNIPGLVEPLSASGQGPVLTDPAIADFQDTLDALIAGTGPQLVVYSPTTGVIANVQSMPIASRWYTLRSRLY